MSTIRVESVSLNRFKSYREQTLPIQPMTILIGRNGSGKSNALDALSLLALLADGRDLTDLERGDSEVAGLRGGLSGSAPFGSGTVEVGAVVDLGDESRASLTLTMDPNHSEVVSETLILHKANGRKITLIDCHRQQPGSGLSDASVYSGGAPRSFPMLAGRMAAAQAAVRILSDTKARTLVVETANAVTRALTGIFVLDPVPASMREYVRLGSAPDRSGSALSAQLYELREDAAAWGRLQTLVGDLLGPRAIGIEFAEGRFPSAGPVGAGPVDVMAALVELGPDGRHVVPASNMSDGTLRYLSILATLFAIRAEPRVGVVGTAATQRTVVLEEVENGLYPEHAARVLEILRVESRQLGINLVTTTHSPALLDALQPDDHEGVVISERNAEGLGLLTPLVSHPRYIELVESGRLGDTVTRGMLDRPIEEEKRLSLSEILA